MARRALIATVLAAGTVAPPAHAAEPALYPTGEAPGEASVFNLAGPGTGTGAGKAIDLAAGTAWSTRRSNRGIEVTPVSGDWRRIAVITDTPGWTLEVYWSKARAPGGPASGDWNQAVFVSPASRRSRWKVPDARHYLVWVADPAGGRVRVNEIQLFRG